MATAATVKGKGGEAGKEGALALALTPERKTLIDETLQRFLNSRNASDLTFPDDLEDAERRYLAVVAGQWGLKFCVGFAGSGDSPKLTLCKTKGSNSRKKEVVKTLRLTGVSLMNIHSLDPNFFRATAMGAGGNASDRPQLVLIPGSNNIVNLSSNQWKWPQRQQWRQPPNSPFPGSDRPSFINRLLTCPEPRFPPPPASWVSKTFIDHRRSLPVWTYREEILKAIKTHSVVFIKGNPGTGKSTQIPQFILEDATIRRTHVRVICTLPSRIAAVSLSERVAAERGEPLGHTVGYQIRLEQAVSPTDTLLTYCTSDVLIRSLTTVDYSVLKNVTHIIVDEVQERDRLTEFLLACLRDVGPQFPKLKLILMGADVNARILPAYFGGRAYCPVVHVKEVGLYPVTTFHLEDVLKLPGIEECTEHLAFAEYPKDTKIKSNIKENHESASVDFSLILKLLRLIHAGRQLDEAVLVFLPGYEEIVTLKQMLLSSDMKNQFPFIVVFLLHPDMHTGDQKSIFESIENNKRKIVLATKIAETSLTIADVVHVIDTGRVREKVHDPMTGLTEMRSMWISRASAHQRMTRASRSTPGACFRLYSIDEYRNFIEFPIPELRRSSLVDLCLYTRAFIANDKKIEDFLSYMVEPPAPLAIKNAIENLTKLGALDQDQQLTRLGLRLFDLPVEPTLGKALVYAIALKCLDPVLTFVSIISYSDPFVLDGSEEDTEKKILKSKLEFSEDTWSDHLANIKAFQEWEKSNLFQACVEQEFCNKRHLSPARFEMIYGIRAQLLGQIRAAGFISSANSDDLKDVNVNSDNWSLVKGILVSALYPNVCCIDWETKTLVNELEGKLYLHPLSTLAAKISSCSAPRSEWIVYDEVSRNNFSRCVKNCTVVSEVALALFGDSYTHLPVPHGLGHSAEIADDLSRSYIAEQTQRFDLNSWITFRGQKQEIEAVLYLRKRLNQLIEQRVENPLGIMKDNDEIVGIVAKVLEEEDGIRGFKEVDGIGQWPKMASGNVLAVPCSGFDVKEESANGNSDSIGSESEDNRLESLESRLRNSLQLDS